MTNEEEESLLIRTKRKIAKNKGFYEIEKTKKEIKK